MPIDPDPRATLELLQQLTPGYEVAAEWRDKCKAAEKRLAEVEAERREAHVFLTGKGGEISWCMAHPNGEPDTELGKAAKAVCIDRDAGWQAAEALAEALDELLYAISQWRQGGMRAEGCQLAEAGASKARAAYTAARAARNPNPEGRT